MAGGDSWCLWVLVSLLALWGKVGSWQERFRPTRSTEHGVHSIEFISTPSATPSPLLKMEFLLPHLPIACWVPENSRLVWSLGQDVLASWTMGAETHDLWQMIVPTSLLRKLGRGVTDLSTLLLFKLFRETLLLLKMLEWEEKTLCGVEAWIEQVVRCSLVWPQDPVALWSWFGTE